MTILGYDIDGQPLRAGDRVMIVRGEDGYGRDFDGMQTLVVGPSDRESFVEVDIKGGSATTRPCHGECLRKLPPKSDHQPADEEFATWLRGIGMGVEA